MNPYYEHAGITIYHGDCREILPQLPKVDAVISDPPYGILSEDGSAATRRSGGNIDDGVMEWDIAPSEELLRSLVTMTDSAMLWGGCHLNLPPTFGYLIWDKQIDGLNFGEVEFCWTNMRFAPRVFRYRAVGIDGGKIHPTQKPIALMKWCIVQCDYWNTPPTDSRPVHGERQHIARSQRSRPCRHWRRNFGALLRDRRKAPEPRSISVSRGLNGDGPSD